MLKLRLRASLIAVLMMLSLFGQGTWVLAAGTTGTLTGTVVEAGTGKPLPGVRVTATSPSQTSSATTSASGNFAILGLAPDTYTVSAELSGYQSNSSSGVTVVTDTTRVVSLQLDKTLRTIGKVTSRSAGNLVRPGTTADVYSINPAQQAKVAAAGGGGNQDSAFSALSTVPGVTVLPGQSGYIGAGATLSIRGGDYDQIGYQVDGIPVNRAFDNYPSGATSSLGQQELQVYTGAPPASSTSEGISGYINQVIKTGTNPSFTSVDLGLGTPSYYHKANFEAGGLTSNKRLSYYVGVGGYNQEFRYPNQYNGADLALYGTPYGIGCVNNFTVAQAPSCYTNGAFNGGQLLGPYQLFGTSSVADRDTIGNLHYYFPHQDGSRDDIQLLYDGNLIKTNFYSSTNDQGGVRSLTGINNATAGTTAPINTPFYLDGYNLNLPTGGFLPANYKQYASIYYFPGTDAHAFQSPINPARRDEQNNRQDIVKLQFTKSLGTSAFARAYGYTYFSNWLQDGPQCAVFGGNCGTSSDYELTAHTRGVGFDVSDQVNSQNLLQLGGNIIFSNVIRDNNTQMNNGLYGINKVNARTAIGVLVDSNNPTSGVCYTAAAVPAPCFATAASLNSGKSGAQFATIGQAYAGKIAAAPAANCGTGPCQYLIIGNGQYATYNTVQPTFYGASLTDEFRPTPKLTLNGGLRLDVYQYKGGDTTGGRARQFFYNAYNREMCINKTTGLVETKASINLGVADPCVKGGDLAASFQNPAGNVTQTYPVFQPRLGFTYSVTPSTVFRASYGRYAQPPNSAFEQYNTLQPDAPAQLYGVYGFQQYGFTTPNHPIPPAASNNYDFSLEQAFPGQVSLKFTPFLRSTQNQIQQFYLNRATNFVSGLNVGNQTSRGFEFEFDKGDFAREGLSAKLSFAYTNSYIKYNTLSNGSTVLTPVVNAINTYNGFTKAGGGAACYTRAILDKKGNQIGGGLPDPACVAGSIANPYYNAPTQSPSDFSSTNKYVPYDTIPAGIAISSTQIGVPYVASLVLNERVKRFSIAPVVQYFAGQRYGSPLATAGVDPTACAGALAGTTAGDPRYRGAQAGAPFDATSCGTLTGGIPNPQTGAFDGLGAYVEPSQLLMHLQLSYDVTKNFTLTANAANIVNTCFGGSNVPWKVGGACTYGLVNGGLTGAGLTGATGNTYNPGNSVQPSSLYAYGPGWLQQPFAVYLQAGIKL